MATTIVHKIAFIGDGGVGKTTYHNMLSTGIFEARYIPTIGQKNLHLAGINELGEISQLPTKSSFEIFDLAGQERFGSLGNNLKGEHMDAFFLFFQITSKLSFKNCDFWVDKIRKIQPNATIILIATKLDVKGSVVTLSSIKKFMIKRSIAKYMGISTKLSYNQFKPFIYIDQNKR